MEKLFFFMCILLNLGCMMLAALLFSLRNKGLAVLFLGQSVNPTTAILVLLALAAVFMILAVRLAATVLKNKNR